MKLYSQKDPIWSKDKLGYCSDTIGQSGCFITCLGMLSDETPSAVNGMLKQKSGYTNGCLLVSSKAAEILGLEYNGKTSQYPGYTCIAETDHYKRYGVPQHFFVYASGKMVDPLDTNPTWRVNKYNIVSYRLFKIKEEPMKKDLQKAIELITNKEYGDNMNENEQEDAANDLRDYYEELNKNIENVNRKLAEYKDAEKRYTESITGCREDKDDLVEAGNRMAETIIGLENELAKKQREIETLGKQKIVSIGDAILFILKKFKK